MPERASIDDLTALLQQLRLQQPGAKSTSEATQAQIDLLLARIALLTDTLRDAEWSEPSRAAARLLLADLAMVSAQFRGNANSISERLAGTLETVRLILERTAEEHSGTN